MTERYSISIGHKNVGFVYDLHENWPHVIGTFEPTEDFASVQNIFLAAAEHQKNKRYREFDTEVMRLFQMGIEIKSSDGRTIFKRTDAVQRPGEIGIIHISNRSISFRVIPKGRN